MSSWIVFGGEDQRQHLMANRQQKRAPRTTTNIVVRNGTAATQARASGPAAGNRRRRNRARRHPQVNVRVLSSQNQGRRRFPRRPGVGSRIVFQSITTTLGTVGSNGSDQIECEMTCLLNPATMKEATGSNAFGPLGIYASTYALFKMTRCELVLKPLVGGSAVSGTVVRASWNPTATPSQTSWSSLGARKHIDITPGKKGRFVLTSKDLKGPKDGWYKTNTQGDPMMAFAGALEMHTIGKTMSTYQDRAYEGGLFLAELKTDWQFKDYQQQPGMLNLVKGEDKAGARLITDSNGKMQLVLSNSTSRMARAAASASSKTIWVVTDTIINAGASVFPPPFSWLIRGGWWIVKRAAGAPIRTNETTLDIYASISDARSDTPCISTQTDADIELGGLHFQQLTPGNVGIGDELLMTRSIDAPIPPGQTAPSRIYAVGAIQQRFPQTADEMRPAQAKWINKSNTQISAEGLGFEVNGEKWATYNLMEVSVTFQGGYQQFAHTVPVHLMYGSSKELIGHAVAHARGQNQSSPVLRVSSILFQAIKNQQYNFTDNWRIAQVVYPRTTHADSYEASTDVMAGTRNGTMRIKVVSGRWYVMQFVTIGTINRVLSAGDVELCYAATTDWPTGATNFTPGPHNAATGLLPGYAAGIEFQPLTSSTLASSHTYTNTVYATEPEDPSFGCDDALEFPPPPNEDDLASGGCEFEPLSDTDAEDFGDPEEDEDEELELGPDDDYSDPPISRLVVHPDAQQIYEHLRARFPEREARLAANQLFPSGEYIQFTEMYHNALVDGLSPREARAFALGL
nr:MAG: capsid protein precursor [Mamastrovirus 3]